VSLLLLRGLYSGFLIGRHPIGGDQKVGEQGFYGRSACREAGVGEATLATPTPPDTPTRFKTKYYFCMFLLNFHKKTFSIKYQSKNV